MRDVWGEGTYETGVRSARDGGEVTDDVPTGTWTVQSDGFDGDVFRRRDETACVGRKDADMGKAGD